MDGSIWAGDPYQPDIPLPLYPRHDDDDTGSGCPCEIWSKFIREDIAAFQKIQNEHENLDPFWRDALTWWSRNCKTMRRSWELCMDNASISKDSGIWAQCEPPPCPEAPPPPEHKEIACNADVTDEMGRFFGDLYEALYGGLGSPFTEMSCLVAARQRLKAGGNLDWKLDKRKLPEWQCGCPGTLAICGICLNDSVPGNIMYGYAASTCGLPHFMIYKIAEDAAKEKSLAWPKYDRAAVDFGIDLPDAIGRDDFCRRLGNIKESLQAPPPDCEGLPPCA